MAGTYSPFFIYIDMITTATIALITEEHTQGTGLFPVKVSIGAGNGIHVLLDGDQGVTIADCVSLSKFIESRLDREQEDYSLEVSSYGVGNPLLMPRQYMKNLGRKVVIQTRGGEMLSGRISAANEEGVELTLPKTGKKGLVDETPKNHGIKYADIAEALIEVEF